MATLPENVNYCQTPGNFNFGNSQWKYNDQSNVNYFWCQTCYSWPCKCAPLATQTISYIPYYWENKKLADQVELLEKQVKNLQKKIKKLEQ